MTLDDYDKLDAILAVEADVQANDTYNEEYAPVPCPACDGAMDDHWDDCDIPPDDGDDPELFRWVSEYEIPDDTPRKPTAPCPSKRADGNGFELYCTRESKHSGQHAAGTRTILVAVW